jgi:hypothetical protein
MVTRVSEDGFCKISLKIKFIRKFLEKAKRFKINKFFKKFKFLAILFYKFKTT